jgi:peptidoglycan/LPS O-acetylase OafA/YrhL
LFIAVNCSGTNPICACPVQEKTLELNNLRNENHRDFGTLMPLATSKQKHLLAPDLLRCLAIVMVVVYHISAPIAHDWIDFTLYPLSRYTFFPVSFFWTGVALFFVLSGFCIHLSYLKASNLTWGKFFWLRFWRLYPAYILAVAFFLVVTRVNLHGSSRIMQLVLHAAFLHNISAQYFFGINPAFWSLATEVQLYLLFPFVIFFRQRWGIERCLVVTALVAVLARVLVCILWG